MASSSLVNTVRNYLAAHSMYVVDEWLTGCVEYLTEDSSNSYNENDIKNLAKEQWLLNDLREICPGSLPPNLKELPKTTLNGKFALQINSAIDIGSPAYQQYLKLQKINMENVEATTNFEEKIPSHRMIKLTLTDGVQEISGIEYKPIRSLSCDITPGCKMLLKGPVVCRQGVLLLTQSSLELLGGEVQEIVGTNTLGALLASKLGLSETQDFNTTANQLRNTDIPVPHNQMPPSRTDDNSDIIGHPSRPVAVVTSLQVAEDALFDQLDAIEEQYTNPPKRPRIDNTMPQKKPVTETVNQPEDYPDDNDIFFDEDEDFLREIEAKFDAKEIELSQSKSKGPIPVSSEPFVYIKQINDMEQSDRAGRVFRVKGQIMKLLSKLSVGKDGWTLKCTIVDGTGKIDVEFTSNVLSKLVGYTPQEMNQLKKQMATNPAVKEQAVKALQKAKDTLQVLYCIIEITILEVPKITSLVPFEEFHVNLLNKREINT